MRLIPLYRAPPNAPHHGWRLDAITPSQPPDEWAWVDDGSKVTWYARDGIYVLTIPGRMSPIFAFEVRFADQKRLELPLPGSPVEPPDYLSAQE